MQQFARALRSTVGRIRLVLGRDVNFPAHLMFPHPATRLIDVEDYVARCTGGIQKANNFARNTLKTSLRRMKRNTRNNLQSGLSSVST